ncbi:hypothetical protein C4F50_21270 [Flavobacterium sp. KB82]|uniref:Uncharacterized protein n=1 Tax=Flavobacterium hungaricum TaxID=2082725 RepID=A0ABR9TQ22_9FLAO|nr:hypothetical protein [Flavobacterium hungaricum]
MKLCVKKFNCSHTYSFIIFSNQFRSKRIVRNSCKMRQSRNIRQISHNSFCTFRSQRSH